MSLCIASACGSGTAATGGVQRFRSPTYGYSIEYPAEWSALPAERELGIGEPPGTGGGGTDVLARRANRTVRAMTLPAVVVGAQPVPDETTLEEWTSTVTGIVGAMKGCARPAASMLVRVGGTDARILAYPSCPTAPSLYHLWVVFVHGGRGYQLVWFNTRGREDDDRPLVETMLASVSLPDGVGGR